ncbi:MAG: HAD-IIIA family hydrolase [Gammaproteobacteria bacterium]|nr:HAD-IIIA family hydrolase [Gammaproteobacteria bacterium]MDE2250704.1 HAD-IIIA family hydrolase [Gammaproteobacteria bacterium]
MARRPAPLASIRLLVLDVDGVLTDGGLHYGPEGERTKRFHVRDGHGIRAVAAAGITVAVISGRDTAAVARRCADLGIGELQQGVGDKAQAFESLLARLGIAARECACVGDDSPDVPLLLRAGLAVAVADAHADARRAAHRRTRLPGGAGAVREVCDWLLAARARARR